MAADPGVCEVFFLAGAVVVGLDLIKGRGELDGAIRVGGFLELLHHPSFGDFAVGVGEAALVDNFRMTYNVHGFRKRELAYESRVGAITCAHTLDCIELH